MEPCSEDTANARTRVWNPDGLEGYGELRVLVDGRDLAELVRPVELPHADAEGSATIAGAYAGLAPSTVTAR